MMKRAHRDLRCQLAAAMGYNTANYVEHGKVNQNMNHTFAATAAALEGLAEATQSDQTAVANLTTITFTKTKATVSKGNNKIMIALRNKQNGMWVYELNDKTQTKIDIPTKLQPINDVYDITKMRELVTFLHAAVGYPVVDTWVEAIQKTICNVARNDIDISIQTLTKIRCNSERTYEAPTTKCEVCTTKQ